MQRLLGKSKHLILILRQLRVMHKTQHYRVL